MQQTSPVTGESDATVVREWRNGWGHLVASLRVYGEESEGLRVSLSPPQHGWLGATIEIAGVGAFECRVSQVLNDFVSEVAEGLLAIVNGADSATATAQGEPDAFEFQFTRKPGSGVDLEIVGFDDGACMPPGESIMFIPEQSGVVLRSFVRALVALEEDGAEAYREPASRPFPTDVVAALATMVERPPL